MTNSHIDFIDNELELTENLQSRVDYLKGGHCVDKIIANLLLQNDFLKDEYQRKVEEIIKLEEDMENVKKQIKNAFDNLHLIQV